MLTKPKNLAVEICCYLLIICLCLAIGLPRYLISIDLGDEGFLAYGAVRVMQGQIPNRDFVSLQPPLSFYTLATVFRFFGTSLVSLRTFGLIVYVLIALLVYAVSRNLSGRIISLFAAVPVTVIGMPFFNFIPFAVWQGVLTTLLSMFLFIRAIRTSRRYWAFLAGLATAATILSRHDQGFYLLIAVLVYALAIRYGTQKTAERMYHGQMLFFWTVGIILIMLPLGIYWLTIGAVPYMFEQLIVFPLSAYVKTSSLPMPTFHSGFTLDNIIVALFYLPPIVYILAAIWLIAKLIRRRFYIVHAHITFILVVSTLFYCQVLTRSDLYHLIISLPPFFILYMQCAEALSRFLSSAYAKQYVRVKPGFTRIFTTAVLLIFCVATLSFLLCIKPVFLRSLRKYRTRLSLDRGGLWLEPEHCKSLNAINQIIQNKSKPNDAILSLPYAPMLYFLSERRNPTRWNYLWAGDQTEEDHRQLVKQLKMDAPAVIIIMDTNWMQDNAPIIDSYIKSEYEIAYCLGKVRFYLPADK